MKSVETKLGKIRTRIAIRSQEVFCHLCRFHSMSFIFKIFFNIFGVHPVVLISNMNV
jgi:hypothetical protein